MYCCWLTWMALPRSQLFRSSWTFPNRVRYFACPKSQNVHFFDQNLQSFSHIKVHLTHVWWVGAITTKGFYWCASQNNNCMDVCLSCLSLICHSKDICTAHLALKSNSGESFEGSTASASFCLHLDHKMSSKTKPISRSFFSVGTWIKRTKSLGFIM